MYRTISRIYLFNNLSHWIISLRCRNKFDRNWRNWMHKCYNHSNNPSFNSHSCCLLQLFNWISINQRSLCCLTNWMRLFGIRYKLYSCHSRLSRSINRISNPSCLFNNWNWMFRRMRKWSTIISKWIMYRWNNFNHKLLVLQLNFKLFIVRSRICYDSTKLQCMPIKLSNLYIINRLHNLQYRIHRFFKWSLFIININF